eukprot:GHVP01025184.1.p1 GENE.GHVP01025184.1~~GHVP01025184.1.p1  ORF type:complete len:351 (+),score=74.19 GHVP01025184.1:381-1433(+)
MQIEQETYKTKLLLISKKNGNAILEMIQLKKQIATLKKEITLLKGGGSKGAQFNSLFSNKKINRAPLSRRIKNGFEAQTIPNQRRLYMIRESRDSMNKISFYLRKNDIDDVEFISTLQSDENVRESLHQALEDWIKENYAMKSKYEERTKLLQNQIKVAKQQKDQSLKKISSNKTDEKIAKSLRVGISNRKLTSRISQSKDLELIVEEAQKWKRGVEFQKRILLKKNEKEEATRSKLKELVSLIKKRNISISQTSNLSGIDFPASEWSDIEALSEGEAEISSRVFIKGPTARSENNRPRQSINEIDTPDSCITEKDTPDSSSKGFVLNKGKNTPRSFIKGFTTEAPEGYL